MGRGKVIGQMYVAGFASFEVREFLASGIPDIPMCDELLLLGASPYRLNYSPYDPSLCDRGPTFHWVFGVLDDTMFVSTKLAIPRNLMAHGH
jgi:hypothetical protein